METFLTHTVIPNTIYIHVVNRIPNQSTVKAVLQTHVTYYSIFICFASITNEYHTMGCTAEMNIVHKLQQQMNNYLGCVTHAWSLLLSRERNNK